MEPSQNISEITAGWWFGTCFIFPYLGNFIIPIDAHIVQRGRYTNNQTGTLINPIKYRYITNETIVFGVINHLG